MDITYTRMLTIQLASWVLLKISCYTTKETVLIGAHLHVHVHVHEHAHDMYYPTVCVLCLIYNFHVVLHVYKS